MLRRRVSKFTGVLWVLLALPGGSATAQGPLTLEVDGGRSWPLEDFRRPHGSAGELAPSHAFGVGFAMKRALGFSAVLGFSQVRVHCPRMECGTEEEWVSTQWRVGTRWSPFDQRVSPWVEAMLVIPRVEVRRGADERVSDTSFGTEVGGGLKVALTSGWSLVPSVRRSRFEVDFDGRGVVPITILTAGLGLRVAF